MHEAEPVFIPLVFVMASRTESELAAEEQCPNKALTVFDQSGGRATAQETTQVAENAVQHRRPDQVPGGPCLSMSTRPEAFDDDTLFNKPARIEGMPASTAFSTCCGLSPRSARACA